MFTFFEDLKPVKNLQEVPVIHVCKNCKEQFVFSEFIEDELCQTCGANLPKKIIEGEND